MNLNLKLKKVMTRSLSTMTLLLMSSASLLAQFAGGNGTAGDPWQIADCEQLQLIDATSANAADTLGAHFILMQDIDCSSISNFNPIGKTALEGTTPRFSGNFDGQGHIISNLVINASSGVYVGLFTRGTASSAVSNLGLVDVSITGNSVIGGISGESEGTISNSFVTGDITASSGSNAVGGLVGDGRNATISNSYSTANLTGDDTIGGLIGNGNIITTITNSYATGKISGISNLRGLVGSNIGTCINSYFDIQTTEQNSSGCGAGGEGKTTEQLQAPTSNKGIYANWDINIWDFGSSADYPDFEDTTPPLIAHTATNATGDSILVIFTEAVADSSTQTSAFALSGASSNPVISRLTFVSDSLTLGLAEGTIAEGETITLSYMQRTGTIEDAAGNALADTSDIVVSNRVSIPPTITNAATNLDGSEITLFFSENVVFSDNFGANFNFSGGGG